MAILRTLNEFGRESCVLALDPARICVAACTFCFSQINARKQLPGQQKRTSDDGTFESIINRAYSHAYNPTHFLEWSVKNHMVLCYSNGVEPFQDIPQARGILSTCDRLEIPLWVQTKGINFNEVFDIYKNFHDNSVLCVSFPTDNDQVLKRFEPGTPKAADRIAVIQKAAEAGFHVVLALSPYHIQWNRDPVAFLRKAKSWGISEVFFDYLHLNQRQREVATDKVMIGLAGKTESMEWSEEMLAHYIDIYEFCLSEQIPFYGSGFNGTMFGYPNTLASICPVGVYKRGFQWPYHDGTLFYNLHDEFYQDGENVLDIHNRDFNDSVLVRWSDMLNLMEYDGRRVDQPFSWSSMSELIIVDNIPDIYKSLLKPNAPIQEYYRALWNNPSKKQFAWRHPWAKVAMKPDGTPWLDDAGNCIMLYDPDFIQANKQRICDSLDDFRDFTVDIDDDEYDKESEEFEQIEESPIEST